MRILRHHLYDGGGEVPEGKSTIGHGAYSDGADKSSEIGTLKNLSEGTVEKPDPPLCLPQKRNGTKTSQSFLCCFSPSSSEAACAAS